jgi:hypothetical protein
MNRIRGVLASVCLFAGIFGGESALAQPKQSPAPEQADFFEKKIRPILAENCYSCHGPEKQRGDLRVDGLAHLLKGTDQGPALLPGQPEKSRLIHVLQYQGEIKMPPKGKLPEPVLNDIAAWVKMGAPWPGDSGTIAKKEANTGKDHWAFQPVRKPALPVIKHSAWVKTPIDHFILAKLESRGMTPGEMADKRTLIRRVYYDLIGLPPTAEEIDAFLADSSPDAFANVVDRLLSSPHYGERWGRYWLDVARYADTKGYVFQEERRYAYSYTYRDYVIQSLNDDKPYNQFILEQVAADQLVKNNQADKKSLAAMGFLTLGRRFLNNTHDIIDDRIDVVSRGLLGLTVSCARCHDHKYDPIPTRDYYSLYGVFASSHEPKELPLITEPGESEAYQAFEKELQKRLQTVEEFKTKNKAELDKKNRKFRDELKALERKVDQFKVSAPGSPPRAMVLCDSDKLFNPRVFPRGKPGGGPPVPRQFLEILTGPDRKPFKNGSGRLELAQTIASPDNPLTARVLVNRVWQHHFGKGLVATASDFGVRCEPPSHPELLDYLAARFVEDGWSIKKLHRSILLSAVYQQSSQQREECAKIDPENSFLWRMNRQRLDFEAMRDSLLLVCGNLDLTIGGKSVDITQAPFPKRRTVYAHIDRQNLPGLFRTFDFASPDSSSPGRYETTVPQQALFLMNSPFLIEQVKALLKTPALSGDMADAVKIQKLYRQVFGRTATDQEVALGLAFVQNGQAGSGMGTWERYAQVLLLTNEFMFVD